MKEQIKEALEKATVAPWDFAVFEDSRHVIYDNTYFNRHIAEIVRGGVENEQREEDNAILIANAPEWLRWQNERIEQLEKALEAIEGYGRTAVMGKFYANIARHALGKEE